MIFSRVVNLRSDMGSLSSIASFTDSLIDLIPFSLGSSSGEVTGVVRPDMMEMRGPCTLGEVVRSGYMPVYKIACCPSSPMVRLFVGISSSSIQTFTAGRLEHRSVQIL